MFKAAKWYLFFVNMIGLFSRSMAIIYCVDSYKCTNQSNLYQTLYTVLVISKKINYDNEIRSSFIFLNPAPERCRPMSLGYGNSARAKQATPK